MNTCRWNITWTEKKADLSRRDVSDIQNKTLKNDRSESLFDILHNHRKERDFLTFYRLLQKDCVLTIQECGKKLEMELTLSKY